MTAPNQQVDEFTYEDYLAAQQAINRAYVQAVLPIVQPYAGVAVSAAQWSALLSVLYLLTREARYQSAEIARKFYDSERATHVPPVEIPLFDANKLSDLLGFKVDLDDRTDIRTLRVPEVHPIFLARYEPEWFVEAMGSVEKDFRKPEPINELSPERFSLGRGAFKVLGAGLKEVENGGRATLLEAVNSDHVVKGWARVAGGGESCSFCQMLISRGPVFKTASNAGLDAGSDISAVDVYNRWDETGNDALIDELMNRWHENCDCKVVPVFKYEEWPGRNAYLDALDLWKEVTAGFSGRDAMNAFRRRIEGREKSSEEPVRRLSLVA